jgi:hypothetical protein
MRRHIVLALKIGDDGEAVAAVQQALADGGAALTVSGVFDQDMDAAVRQFQSARNLHVDGVVGKNTIDALGLDWATVDPPGFRREIARVAEREWARWHPNGTKLVETDPAMTGVLQTYYRIGVERHIDAADLQSAAWQSTHFWSAVFISWVMRSVGAGRHFAYSAAHQRYIAAAKRNRLDTDVNNPFWAFPLDELPPEVGDLVCTAREASGATYENIDDGHRACHVDIVTAVDGDGLKVIGGNVGQTVGRKELHTSAGFIDTNAPHQDEFFAVIRVQDF